MTTRNPDRCPTHPGALLREDILPAVGLPKAEIARLLGISRQHLHDILAERKPVSATFSGRVQLSDVDAPNGYTISGEGKGGAAGFAKGGAVVRLAEAEGGTQLSYCLLYTSDAADEL